MSRIEQFVRIVSDPEGHERRVRVMSELHRAGEPAELEERRRWAVDTMRRARADLERELSNVTPALAFKGDRWSVMHVLWHLGARGSHMEPARAIVELGATEVRAVPKREDRLTQGIRLTMSEIDEAVAFAERCTVDQLAMKAKRVNRDVYVIGIIEGTAEHFDDHLNQIRDLKRELGLAVFGGADAAAPGHSPAGSTG